MKELRYDKQYLPFRGLSLPVNLIIGITLFYIIYQLMFFVKHSLNLSITEIQIVILSAFFTPVISYYVGNNISNKK